MSRGAGGRVAHSQPPLPHTPRPRRDTFRWVLTLPTVIQATDVVREFVLPAETVRAVDGVSLSVRPGEFLCLHGASGSGKSTLLNLLAGLTTPDAGTIEIAGRPVSSASVQERADLRLSTVGVVFQHDNLIEEFTAAENVSFPLELRADVPRSSITEESHRWLDAVGMGAFESRFPAELSGGQQQRVGIARALVGGRRVLIADEPTGALDSGNSRDLFELLRELTDTGVAIVLSSHDPMALEYATRSLELLDGRVVGADVHV